MMMRAGLADLVKKVSGADLYLRDCGYDAILRAIANAQGVRLEREQFENKP
jgi:hypothetical protein